MNNTGQVLKNHKIELIIGNLLRTGVILSATIVSLGGVIYLFRHGLAPVNYKIFQRVPSDLCHVGGIVENTLSFHGRALIQLGLLFLIATPVARVFFSMIAFAKQRDTLYAIVAAVVLILLAHSLL